MTNTVCAVVVTYNRKQLLLKCLDSLINQKLKPDAIYIVDNNSTDNTESDLKDAGYITKLPQKNNTTEIIENSVNDTVKK